MKEKLPYIVILVLVCLLVFRPSKVKHVAGEIVRDTIRSVDTIRDTMPVPSYEMFVRRDTVYLPSVVIPTDSGRIDTVRVVVPITQQVYKDSLYTAYVSGYRARLDSINVVAPVMKIFEKESTKRKRWGLGLQVGYGVTNGVVSPYVGVGVSYNLFEW